MPETIILPTPTPYHHFIPTPTPFVSVIATPSAPAGVGVAETKTASFDLTLVAVLVAGVIGAVFARLARRTR